jgi:hypothetical protein
MTAALKQITQEKEVLIIGGGIIYKMTGIANEGTALSFKQ